MWPEAIINKFARVTGRNMTEKCTMFKTKIASLTWPFIYSTACVQNRTLVGNKNSFLGRNLCGGVHKQREVQAVSNVCMA